MPNPNVQKGDDQQGALARSGIRVQGFTDAEMDFQLIRQIGAAAYGGASIGECLAIVQQMTDPSPAQWREAFGQLANEQVADGHRREQKGHRVSARERYLAASNSFRAAEYYTPFADPHHRTLGLASRNAFLRSMALQDHHCEEIWFPFAGVTLPAYFMKPTHQTEPNKTIMIISGFDGTMEESYLQGGRAALDRGYNVFLFAGPGQMDTMRFHPQLTFRPDYERVTGAALDVLLQRPEVHAARVGLLGISYGGYFCLRAAAFDDRIRAVIANSPIVDLHAYMTAFVGFDPAELPAEDDFDLAMLEHIPTDIMTEQQKEMSASLITRFGQRTFKETYAFLRSFRVVEQLGLIRCPALALVGAGEGPNPLAQSEQFCQEVAGPVDSYIFTAAEGADSHCQLGNLSLAAAVTLDWLDEVFGG